jgi:peptide-methionine (S)-S-oxide reductase
MGVEVMSDVPGARGFASLIVAVAVALVAFAGAGVRVSAQAEQPHIVPAPAQDEPAGQRTSEVALLAGGCFWGVQGVYQHVKGVSAAVSGYAGGQQYNAHYEIVSLGITGHAESVQVTFDPRDVSYGKILQIFFSVVHNPTELNRQGPDFGTQYRSAIFPQNDEQAHVARAYIDQLNQAHAFDKAIVTGIEMDRPFYRAEAHHQDFLIRNPTYPYIVYNDLPKISDLKRIFPDFYRDAPALVNGTR